MVDQEQIKFSVGDIVRSRNKYPVTKKWRNVLFRVVRISEINYILEPLEPLDIHLYNELESDGTVSATISGNALIPGIDDNDIEWWMNNSVQSKMPQL